MSHGVNGLSATPLQRNDETQRWDVSKETQAETCRWFNPARWVSAGRAQCADMAQGMWWAPPGLPSTDTNTDFQLKSLLPNSVAQCTFSLNKDFPDSSLSVLWTECGSKMTNGTAWGETQKAERACHCSNSNLPQFPSPVKSGWSQTATEHYKHELINGHRFSDEENHDFSFSFSCLEAAETTRKIVDKASSSSLSSSALRKHLQMAATLLPFGSF